MLSFEKKKTFSVIFYSLYVVLFPTAMSVIVFYYYHLFLLITNGIGGVLYVWEEEVNF